MGQFGDKFRKAREAKKISLDDASNVTKIGARMLQAIEEEKFDVLPGGVFNKGFIRAYAKHLGINDEEAVTEYLACLRQAQVEAQAAAWEPAAPVAAPVKRAPVAPKRAAAKASSSPTQVEELQELQVPREDHVRPPRQKYLEGNDGGISWRLWAVVAVVLVLGLVLWRRHLRAVENEASRTPAPVTQAVPAIQTAPAAQAAPAVNAPPAPASSASAGQPGSDSAAGAATHVPAAAKATPQATKAAGPTTQTAGGKTSAAAGSTKPPADEGENSTEAPAVAASPVDAAAVPLKLVIRATENSWISVSADGKTVNQETLIAPANTSVRANRQIVAKVGNAAGVTFLWNGKEIPAQGEESEVKTFVFDAVGMRVITPQGSGQNP